MSEWGLDQSYNIEWRVDIVLCVDGTASMRSMIEQVKETAKSLDMMFLDVMQKKVPPMAVKEDGLRFKVIVFRRTTKPLEESDFFSMEDPAQREAFYRFVDGINIEDDGDTPANALEAIATAVKSQWQSEGGRYRRQMIFVFTGTSTYDLSNYARRDMPFYSDGMPRNAEELESIWNDGSQEFAPNYSPRRGRMVIFAPMRTGFKNDDPDSRIIEWERLSFWDRVWLVPVKENGRCEDFGFYAAMDVLVGDF